MWSAEGQRERFDAIYEAVNLRPGECILDFGCGTGAFSDAFPTDQYRGYDWSFPMVERARREHPYHEFVSTLSWQHFDAIVCVGTFNLPGSYAETWQTLNSLWTRTDRVLAVSLYYGDDENCLSYDEYDCCDFAKNRASRWRIEKHRHNDLLLVMWK